MAIGRSRCLGGAVVAVAMLTGLFLAATTSPAFLRLAAPAAPRRRQLAARRVASPGAPTPSAEGQAPESSGHWRAPAAAFVVALLLAGALPQPSLAEESPKASSEDQTRRMSSKKGKDRSREYAQSRAKVLEDAADNAKKQAQAKEEEAAQKTKAEELYRKLDKDQTAKFTKREAQDKKEDAVREKILADLEKRGADPNADPNLPKAQKFFRQFFVDQKAVERAKEEKMKKEAEVRQKVLDDLEKRRAAAQKAAEEAEAIAARIEELAKTAKAAAEAARATANAAVANIE